MLLSASGQHNSFWLSLHILYSIVASRDDDCQLASLPCTSELENSKLFPASPEKARRVIFLGF
jgi:hypothetical protein